MLYGLLHASGALMTDPLGGVPVGFDTIEEARAWAQPGCQIVRLVEDPHADHGLRPVALDAE